MAIFLAASTLHSDRLDKERFTASHIGALFVLCSVQQEQRIST